MYLLYKVLTNCQPWGKRRNIFVIMEGVAAGKRPERPLTHECNDALWSLISRCWDFDPAQRPDITQVCTSVHQPEINDSSGMCINLSIILAVRMNIIYSSRINHCFPILLVQTALAYHFKLEESMDWVVHALHDAFCN